LLVRSKKIIEKQGQFREESSHTSTTHIATIQEEENVVGE